AHLGLVDREVVDVTLLLEDRRDVALELGVRHGHGVVERRTGVTHTREHVRDGVGHRHGWTMFLSRNGSHATRTVRRPGGPPRSSWAYREECRLFSCAGPLPRVRGHGVPPPAVLFSPCRAETAGPSARRRGPMTRGPGADGRSGH